VWGRARGSWRTGGGGGGRGDRVRRARVGFERLGLVAWCFLLHAHGLLSWGFVASASALPITLGDSDGSNVGNLHRIMRLRNCDDTFSLRAWEL
jgi:hypothetical protein